MKLNNNICVIIPVYNAEDYVSKAVESALMQPETAEIILVEDGSKDNSHQICEQLAIQYEKVKLYIHPGNVNKGAGHSRNLGIKKATSDFIAFLDADDFYLPERFQAERVIFKEKPLIDGVYGALGFHYYTLEGEKMYKEGGFNELTTVSGIVAPNELFQVLMGLHNKVHGYFSINTLTIKKEVFQEKSEMFNELNMHEDTVFFLQLALNCTLEPGILNKPIGLRGVHNNNRIVNNPKKSESLLTMWKYLYKWSLKAENGKQYSQLFHSFLMKEEIILSGKFFGILKLGLFSVSNKIFFQKAIFFNPATIHIFGKYIGGHLIMYKERILRKIFKIEPYSFSNLFKTSEGC